MSEDGPQLETESRTLPSSGFLMDSSEKQWWSYLCSQASLHSSGGTGRNGRAVVFEKVGVLLVAGLPSVCHSSKYRWWKGQMSSLCMLRKSQD